MPAGSSKWVHQDIAVKTFLEKEHGILAMATGTGKTVTAMKIINKLFDSGEIRRVVITMYGNDLLDQWAIQIRENYKNKQINYHYASQKMMKDFVMHPDDSILILSRDARNLSKLLDLFDRLPAIIAMIRCLFLTKYMELVLILLSKIFRAGSLRIDIASG